MFVQFGAREAETMPYEAFRWRCGLRSFHNVVLRFDYIVYQFIYVIRLLQKLGGCSLGGFLHGLIGLLAKYSNLLLRGCILLGVQLPWIALFLPLF